MESVRWREEHARMATRKRGVRPNSMRAPDCAMKNRSIIDIMSNFPPRGGWARLGTGGPPRGGQTRRAFGISRTRGETKASPRRGGAFGVPHGASGAVFREIPGDTARRRPKMAPTPENRARTGPCLSLSRRRSLPGGGGRACGAKHQPGEGGDIRNKHQPGVALDVSCAWRPRWGT
jgi:hypothetical protein